MSRREAALDQVLLLVTLLNEDMASSLGAQGLTPARAHVLWELLHRGPSTQTALAGALRVTPRNVTTLVDALADLGMVIRAAHPTDRRAALVTFTDRGRAVAEAMALDHSRLADLFFEGMTSDVFEAFDAGLDRIIGRLRAHLHGTSE